MRKVENCMVAVVLGDRGGEDEVVSIEGLVRMLGARSLIGDAYWR